MAEKIAKIATKNRQSCQMVDFRQTYCMKLVEHQILCKKFEAFQTISASKSLEVCKFKNFENLRISKIKDFLKS